MVHEPGVRYRGDAVDGDADSDRNRDNYEYAGGYGNADPDGYRNRDQYGDDNSDRNGYAYADDYPDPDDHAYADKYADAIFHADADANPAADRYAPADADAYAVSDGSADADAAADRYAASGCAMRQESKLEKSKITVDFHVHSEYSSDSVTKIEDLAERARILGLGKLVVTDHNTIKGALILKKRYPEFVIVGEEILTTRGEVLAFFVEEEIPRGLTPLETFRRLRDQGAFISLAHPYSYRRHGWLEEEMIEYGEFLDAIEIANARNTVSDNEKAAAFAAAHGIPGTAGSDAHGLDELGRMTLRLAPFNSADELRRAVRAAEVVGSTSSRLVRITSRAAVLQKKLGFYHESDRDPDAERIAKGMEKNG